MAGLGLVSTVQCKNEKILANQALLYLIKEQINK